MALQPSGEIRASQIKAEFGDSGPSVVGKNYPPGSVSFGAYRDVSESHGGKTFTLDHNFSTDTSHIPRRGATGSIKFSDFYNAKLNVVCAYGTPPGTRRGNTVRERYNSNDGIFVIGNFKNKPNSNASDFKFVIYVHGTLPSKKGNRNFCALRTGKFNSELEVNLIVGSTARIYGAGGDGGHGGRWRDMEDPPGDPGQDGTSAIGVQTNINILRIETNAIVMGGGGGGGGGGASKYYEENQTAGGGGGGGGAGSPYGLGGGVGFANDGDPDGTAGQPGSSEQGGDGGDGGAHSSGNACGGGGGAGGSWINSGNAGSGGTQGGRSGDNGTEGSGGDGGTGGRSDAAGSNEDDNNGQTGGEGGYAIIVESGSSVSQYVNNDLAYGTIVLGGGTVK